MSIFKSTQPVWDWEDDSGDGTGDGDAQGSASARHEEELNVDVDRPLAIGDGDNAESATGGSGGAHVVPPRAPCGSLELGRDVLAMATTSAACHSWPGRHGCRP